MPDRIEKLRKRLSELEAELAALPASEIDDETRVLIEGTVSDIEAAVRREPAQIEPESLVERLERAAQGFESSHPALFELVSRAAEALSKIGL